MIRHNAIIEVSAVVDRVPILVRLAIAKRIAVLPEQIPAVPLSAQRSRLP